MLEGKDLGAALKEAMALKGVNQPEVAAEFGVRQPSVSEWTKYGRIAKKHLPHLVRYFSTHVKPEHWGLPSSWALQGAVTAIQLAAMEREAPYGDTSKLSVWPLDPFITRDEWEAMDPALHSIAAQAAKKAVLESMALLGSTRKLKAAGK